MNVKNLFDIVYQKAIDFGMVAKNNGATITKGNAIVRENISPNAFVDGTTFFGFISPESGD